MAEVVIDLGGRQHRVACADGSEHQVRRIGLMLQQRWQAAEAASGAVNTERTMFFVALMLADALDEAQRNPGNAPAGEDPLLADIAQRLEAIASALEDAGQTP